MLPSLSSCTYSSGKLWVWFLCTYRFSLWSLCKLIGSVCRGILAYLHIPNPSVRFFGSFHWRNYSFYISHATHISNISDLCNLPGSLRGEDLALQHVYSSLALNISELCNLPGSLCAEDLALQHVYSALALVEKNKEIVLTKRKIGNCTRQKKDREIDRIMHNNSTASGQMFDFCEKVWSRYAQAHSSPCGFTWDWRSDVWSKTNIYHFTKCFVDCEYAFVISDWPCRATGHTDTE